MDNRNRQRPQQKPPQGGNNINRIRKRKKKNLLPVLILGIIVVIVLALIIMGVRALFDQGEKTAEEKEPTSSSVLDVTEPTPTPEPTPSPEPTPATEKSITNANVQDLDDMVIVDDSAYEYYKFSTDSANSFIEVMNKGASSAAGQANVYSLILPSAVDIMLPLSFLNDYAAETSDQEKAIQYIYSKYDSSIKPVSVYSTLKAHCDEEIFFRTDNHISGLGGFYVYEALAGQLGVDAIPLSDYTVVEYNDFLGNLFVKTENSAISSPETLVVYEPKGNYGFSYLEDGVMTEGSLFPDVSEYGSMYKYSAYMTGSHGYAEITNPNASNNDSCVVVIDSNGTPIAPYISQHYKTTYVVDYRDYTDSVASLAKEKGAKDIIYITSIVATRAESLIYGLEAVAG